MKKTPAELWDELVFCNPDERMRRLQMLIDAAETVKTLAQRQRRAS